MESLRKVGAMAAPQSSSTASKDDLKQVQCTLQQRLQEDLQTVSSRICEVQSSVQSSLDGYAKCLSQSGKLQESQFEKFHTRLSKLEQCPHPGSANTDRLSQSLPHDRLQGGRSAQPQPHLPNVEELSPSSFLEQLRRDAAILPENILDCSERPLTPRSMAANADRLSQSLPLDMLQGKVNPDLTEAEMQGRANARAEFMGGQATSTPSGYNPNPVTANTDRLCHSLPAPESPRNIWASDPPSPRSRSARAESPRQVWSSDLPPSPRQKSK